MITACVLLSAAGASSVQAAASAASADGETQKVPERGDIQTEYLWNLETTFKDLAAWEAEYAAVEKEVDKLAELRGSLSTGPDGLLDALKIRDDTAARLERVYVYASLTADQDARESAGQAMRSRARSLAVAYGQATSWMDPELTSVPFETLDSWMERNDDLAVYRQAFDNLFRQKKHILSEREEELIAMGGQVFSTPYAAYRQLANADLVALYPSIEGAEGEAVELSDSAFYMFMRSPDRRVRKEAYQGIVGTYAKLCTTGAALLTGVVQSHVFTVKARDYESCLAASLDGGNIPVKVYNTLVEAVNDNLPLLHRYQAIRKRALKLDDGVQAYDLFAPFVADAKLEYTYEEGVETIMHALVPLGPEYCKIMKNGFDSRWVDVYPTKGKRSGAYSSGTFLTQPYILLNYHGTYDNVSTLAHEMGHSMHSHFSRGTQPYVYADYDIFCTRSPRRPTRSCCKTTSSSA